MGKGECRYYCDANNDCTAYELSSGGGDDDQSEGTSCRLYSGVRIDHSIANQQNPTGSCDECGVKMPVLLSGSKTVSPPLGVDKKCTSMAGNTKIVANIASIDECA